MARLRSYAESAERRRAMRGPLADFIARGEAMPRTLPRDPASRDVLIELGERPERLGPPAVDTKKHHRS